MTEEIVRKIIEEIQDALKNGRKVIINGVVVQNGVGVVIACVLLIVTITSGGAFIVTVPLASLGSIAQSFDSTTPVPEELGSVVVVCAFIGSRKGWRTRRVNATASATPITSFLTLARIVTCPLKVF